MAAAADAVLKAMERVAEEPVADHNDIIGEAERVAQASTANTGDSPDGYAIAAVQVCLAPASLQCIDRDPPLFPPLLPPPPFSDSVFLGSGTPLMWHEHRHRC